MDIIISLVCGALGGNIGGALFKNLSLGTLGNSIAGILGGGIGGTLLGSMGMLGADGGIGSIITNVVGSGIGGTVLLAIVGFVRKAMGR